MNISSSSQSFYEYIVIGAGPAGLQLGYFLKKAGRQYFILEEADAPGNFFRSFPRHKKLISTNKRYTGYNNPEINLRWDWNSLLSDDESMLFKHYSKEYFPATDDYVNYLGDFATHFNLNIRYGCQVVRIAKDGNFMLIDSNGNVFCTPRLIIATGLSKPYLPEISGIELAENYTNVSVDPEDFIDQRVLIIGKGNSGFETADNLVSTTSLINIVSPNPVSLAWKTKYVGHLRAVNNNLIDTYQLKSQNVVLDAYVEKIEKKNDRYIVTFNYTHANGELEELIYDRVIVCTGFQFDNSIFDESSRPELTINDRFPNQTSEWESTNIKDLYFAGALTHMRDFKKKQSGFIHGFRYNVRALHHILEYKYHHQALPFQVVDKNSEALTKATLSRVNITSALWQQTGFLCDLIVVSDDAQQVKYYQDLSVDYIHDSELGQNEHYYVVTLEFGLDVIFASPDPLAVERVHKDDVDNAALSPGIHPIIRRFCRNTMVFEHHVIEDIASEWLEDVHVWPLEKFFQNNLSKQSKPLGILLLEAGLVNTEQLDIALNAQKTKTVRLGEILAGHGWVKQRTVEYLMKKVVHQQLSGNGQRLGSYLVDAGLVNEEQLEIALNEQKTTALCLGQILAQHGWVNQQTVEYLMEKVVLPERQVARI
jgi:thioredoxin reductase